MSDAPIYLDHNATTPLDPAVAAAMAPYLHGHHGNPSSSHALGREARAAVENARGEVAALIGAEPDEIVFTSGGSESDNMAIFGTATARVARGKHLVTTAVEHPAVLEPCRVLAARGWQLTVAAVDARGRVDADEMARELRDDTVLVSVMHANNEVGTIEPVAAIAAACRPRGIWLHCDAAQSVGKIPVDVDDLGVDLLTIAGHKLHGPKGIGALYIRRGREIEPFVHGAGHEQGRRAGTENVLAIVGLGTAARIARERLAEGMVHSRDRRDRLLAALRAELGDGLVVHGDLDHGLPNTLSVALPGVRAAELLRTLGDRLAASPGAACHADGIAMSSVLAAMQVPMDVAAGTVRFSVGRATTVAEVDEAAALIAHAVRGN